jgi:beta-glucosidase
LDLFFRFIHPIVYGEYPKTLQNIVGKRLPKFTKEQVKMVKGSMDFVGINQYTSYYMYEPHLKKQPKYLGYQQDWNAGFACMISISFTHIRYKKRKRKIRVLH